MGNLPHPLVSIIIPLYNNSDYIEECLDSVINQKYKNIEIIVIDDGSSDNSAEIVERYKSVKLIKQANQGVTVARKTGVECATGEWIMFVDADDSVEEGIISSWLPQMREDVDIIIGKMKRNKEVSPEQLTYDLLEIRLFPRAPWLKIFRRGLFDNKDVLDIPRAIVWGEDLLMLLRLAMVSKGKIIYSKERNYRYRRHPSQITKTFRVTSDYEHLFHSLLERSIPPEKINNRLIRGLVSYRLHIFEIILRNARDTCDNVRESEWFRILNEDIVSYSYKPSKWFQMLLKHGNADNITRLRSFKWVFKCINAF